MKLSWDFSHHYASGRVSIVDIFADWPKISLDKVLPSDKFSFKQEDATHYEDPYWRFDLVSFLSLLLGPSLLEHPLISEYYGEHKILKGESLLGKLPSETYKP